MNKYDLIIKDLFQKDHPTLLDRLTRGTPVRQVLNIELPVLLERRADLVLLLDDETIEHIEFQSHNDRDMPCREGMYALMIAQKYRRRSTRVSSISARKKCE